MDIEQPADPLRTCAYSGVQKPESQMVQIGGHWIAAEYKTAAVQYLQQGNEFEARLHPGMQATAVKLGPMLSRSWDLFRKHAGLLIALHLTITLPADLLHGFVDERLVQQILMQMRQEGRLTPIALLLLMAVPMGMAILSSFGSAAILAALSRSWNGVPPDYWGSWATTTRRSISVLAASFLTMLLFMTGLVFCVIPGIAVLVKLTFCDCYVMDRGAGGAQSLGCSFHLTKGRFWMVLGCMVLVSLMTIAPSVIVSAGLESLHSFRNVWAAQGSIEALLSIPAIFLTVFTFVFYKALSSPEAAAIGAPVAEMIPAVAHSERPAGESSPSPGPA